MNTKPSYSLGKFWASSSGVSYVTMLDKIKWKKPSNQKSCEQSWIYAEVKSLGERSQRGACATAAQILDYFLLALRHGLRCMHGAGETKSSNLLNKSKRNTWWYENPPFFFVLLDHSIETGFKP